MLILLTNDDGIYAPGLQALEAELRQLGDVVVVAPATEQSGVGHSITFLQPLVAKQVFDGERLRGWAVEGSPADSVKLGIFEFCPRRPDLVVSGINGGLNAGINVLYSGTVAAAIEGAFFGITSIACSLEYNEHANFKPGGANRRRHHRADPGAERPGAAALQSEHPDGRLRAAERGEDRADGRGSRTASSSSSGPIRAAARTTGPRTIRRRSRKGTKPI